MEVWEFEQHTKMGMELTRSLGHVFPGATLPFGELKPVLVSLALLM